MATRKKENGLFFFIINKIIAAPRPELAVMIATIRYIQVYKRCTAIGNIGTCGTKGSGLEPRGIPGRIQGVRDQNFKKNIFWIIRTKLKYIPHSIFQSIQTIESLFLQKLHFWRLLIRNRFSKYPQIRSVIQAYERDNLLLGNPWSSCF